MGDKKLAVMLLIVFTVIGVNGQTYNPHHVVLPKGSRVVPIDSRKPYFDTVNFTNMKSEPRYVSLEKLVEKYVAEGSKNKVNPIDLVQAMDNEIHRGGLPPHMQWYFNFPPGHFTDPKPDPIITEDIECEIIDPKQLPQSK